MGLDGADRVMEHFLRLQEEKDREAAVAAARNARTVATDPIFGSPPTATEESFDPHHTTDFGSA